MGKVADDDGSIMRSDLDGRNVKTIVPAGGTYTPKQLKIDTVNRKLYWSDREGMRVMRSNLDGSAIETLIVTGTSDADRKDAARWCVGIAVDTHGGKVYWTQKGGDNANKGTIRRANLKMPAGATAATRKDIEVLFANLPEPIDLDIDNDTRLLYWTDRGDNTISRAPLDPPAKFDPEKRTDREIVLRDVGEAIGIALDMTADKLYYTSLGGVVGSVALDGTNAKVLLSDQGALTGIVALDR
jgi:sugar lactone lactonase YvrE